MAAIAPPLAMTLLLFSTLRGEALTKKNKLSTPAGLTLASLYLL
jgi:hypothetical protein